MFDFKNDSYIGMVGQVEPLIWIRDSLVSVGWVVDKIVSGTIIYDDGRGLFYPWSQFYPQNGAVVPSDKIRNYLMNLLPSDRYCDSNPPLVGNYTGYKYLPDTNTGAPGFDSSANPIGKVRVGTTLTNKSFNFYYASTPTAGYGIDGYKGDSLGIPNQLTAISGATQAAYAGAGWGGNGYNIMKWSWTGSFTAGEYLYGYRPSSYGYLGLGISQIQLVNPIDYINKGTYTSELYLHSTTTYGDKIYYSIKYSFSYGRIYIYSNKGFDTGLAIDRQPGTVASSDNAFYDYYYMDIEPMFFALYPSNCTIVADTNHFFINIFSQKYANSMPSSSLTNQWVYGGILDKFFTYSGGQIIMGTSYLSSSFYIDYEGSWYGSSIVLSRTGKQGYTDLVTPTSYTTAGYNFNTGELLLTQQVAGVNLTGVNNSEYRPLGSIHNFYKHYGVIPAINMPLYVNKETYYSIFLDANNHITLKLS
ncbi:MAG: hypothetical protein JHC33_09425 [Ignisphaera sp.]|nr:hypothetical protein [Ignisphaera sp.]